MSSGLAPFISFFGSKYTLAPYYPPPRYETVIEPFAGGAGYSLLHYRRDVVLYDIDPVICGVWRYLIKASAAEIMALPADAMSMDDVKGCQEAKSLVGFWFNRAITRPRPVKSGWARKSHITPQGNHQAMYWGRSIRDRIARQVRYIKHWKVVNKNYYDTPDTEATWFIDPPYQNGGTNYCYNRVNYQYLGQWCRSRTGQAIVCEIFGAQWLPFEMFRPNRTARKDLGDGQHRKIVQEAIWTNDT